MLLALTYPWSLIGWAAGLVLLPVLTRLLRHHR